MVQSLSHPRPLALLTSSVEAITMGGSRLSFYGPSAPEQAGLSHQAGNALSGAAHAQRPQLKVDPRRTVGLAAIPVDADDLLRKQGISLSPCRGRSASPAIKAALLETFKTLHIAFTRWFAFSAWTKP